MKNISCLQKEKNEAEQSQTRLQSVQIWRSLFCLHLQMATSLKKNGVSCGKPPSPLFNLHQIVSMCWLLPCNCIFFKWRWIGSVMRRRKYIYFHGIKLFCLISICKMVTGFNTPFNIPLSKISMQQDMQREMLIQKQNTWWSPAIRKR